MQKEGEERMQCKVVGELFRVIEALEESERVPRDYGTGSPLYHSEVNLLEAVYYNSNLNAMELSEKMGVTRAAITQTATRLAEKGFLNRRAKEGNRKEKLFELTPLGKALHEGHEEYHRRANERMCAYICALTNEETEIILRFLTNIIDSIPVSRHECTAEGGCQNARDYHDKRD